MILNFIIFILFFILCKSTLQCRKISHSETFEKFQCENFYEIVRLRKFHAIYHHYLRCKNWCPAVSGLPLAPLRVHCYDFQIGPFDVQFGPKYRSDQGPKWPYTLSLTQCTLSRLSLRHAVRRPRSPSLHFTCASRDSLIIGIYLARLSRQVLDKPAIYHAHGPFSYTMVNYRATD